MAAWGGWQLAFGFKGLLTIFAVLSMARGLWCAVAASFGGGAAWGIPVRCQGAGMDGGATVQGWGMRSDGQLWRGVAEKRRGFAGTGVWVLSHIFSALSASFPCSVGRDEIAGDGARGMVQSAVGGVGVAEKAAAGVFKGWSANYFTGANGRRCMALGCRNIITLTLSAFGA